MALEAVVPAAMGDAAGGAFDRVAGEAGGGVVHRLDDLPDDAEKRHQLGAAEPDGGAGLGVLDQELDLGCPA